MGGLPARLMRCRVVVEQAATPRRLSRDPNLAFSSISGQARGVRLRGRAAIGIGDLLSMEEGFVRMRGSTATSSASRRSFSSPTTVCQSRLVPYVGPAQTTSVVP